MNNNGKIEKISISQLEKLLIVNKNVIEKLDLVIVSTCFSGDFGELFLKYGAKNVIYICRKTAIYDNTSIKFSEYFYKNLIEDNSIMDSFNKAKELLKYDKEIQIPCCCLHFHSNTCEFGNWLKDSGKNHYNYFHEQLDESCTCKGKYTYFNLHSNDCTFLQKLSSDEKLKMYRKEEIEDNTFKTCCCGNNEVIHSEIEKIIYKSRESESNKNICPFKYNGEGKVFVNSKISFYFDTDKNISTIGRKKLMSQLFKNIKRNNSILNYLIIYGEKGLLKQDFAESLCVYLNERNIINSYEIFRIKSDFDYSYMQYRIREYTETNCINRNLKIINIDFENIDESIKIIKKIYDLYSIYDYHIYNLFFIFIIY